MSSMPSLTGHTYACELIMLLTMLADCSQDADHMDTQITRTSRMSLDSCHVLRSPISI